MSTSDKLQYDRVNEAKLRENGLSDFGVLAQIWAVGPNLTIQSNRIFNVDNEKVFTLNLLGLL